MADVALEATVRAGMERAGAEDAAAAVTDAEQFVSQIATYLAAGGFLAKP